ncbi:MAG: septal ring lytic transglycosylase RlpA family protein [Candidatus Aminicenantes bacterium]|nr:MAG: septal ring lytic transglycosylase RlpA family protein [Candidatus Aminicenantes bacterium]
MTNFFVFRLFFIFALVAFSFVSCARVAHTPPEVIQTGVASWYGPNFHGKTTSNKEVYDMHDLTAAHKSLPFGTYVVVTNLNNGKSVTVRINDRGPFVKGRIIDLSYAAAKAVDMIGSGTAPVKLEILTGISPKRSSQKFSVQVGSFTWEKNAKSLKNELQKDYKNVYIVRFKTVNQVYYRVRIKAEDQDKARAIARRLTRAGYSAIVLEEQ